MEDKEADQEALEQIRKVTESEPVGEDEELLKSPELERSWREAEERLRKGTAEPAEE